MTLEQLLKALGPILLQAAGAVALVALPFVAQHTIRWLRVKTAEVAARLETNKQYQLLGLLQALAGMAVKAAEQELGGQAGATKKAYAVQFIAKWLQDYGIVVDSQVVDQIATAVEAAVYGEIAPQGLEGPKQPASP